MKKIRLIDRREFLKEGLLFGASLSVGLREFCKRNSLTSSAFLASPRHNHKLRYIWTKPLLDPYALKPFVDPLPIMPTARPTGFKPPLNGTPGQSPVYSITMRQAFLKLHRDLKPTVLWGYNGIVPGPTIETMSNQSIFVNWINALPTQHPLTIDHSVHGAESNKPDVRNVVHLHGAKVQPDSDGFPEAWFVPGSQANYFYPNQMDPTMLWYHDHALGITRLNVFMGLLGTYFIRDQTEAALNLPSGKFEIPLVIFDRSFEPNGQFNYPVSGNPAVPHVPEYFGNVMLVNGKVMPFLNVQPRKYRFRIVNACNGRFLNMSLSSGQPFIQIGSDQGLLRAPVNLQTILMTPAERFDIVLDFSQFAGKNIELTNDAAAPWPGGGQITPNLVMQFRVAKHLEHKDTSVVPASAADHRTAQPRDGGDDAQPVAGRIRRRSGLSTHRSAGRQTLGRAGNRDASPGYDRDLEPGQHHRRWASDSYPSDSLSDHGPDAFRRRPICRDREPGLHRTHDASRPK